MAWKVNRYLALIGLVLGWSEVVVSRIYEISLWLIRRRCRCLHLGWRWPGYIYPGTVWPHLYSGRLQHIYFISAEQLCWCWHPGLRRLRSAGAKVRGCEAQLKFLPRWRGVTTTQPSRHVSDVWPSFTSTYWHRQMHVCIFSVLKGSVRDL